MKAGTRISHLLCYTKRDRSGCGSLPAPHPLHRRCSVAARQSIADRFWSKVDRRGPDECWPWMTSLMTSGYGQFFTHTDDHRRTRLTGSHRMAWVLSFGPIPEGQNACHRCDFKLCCNPRHLFLGTQAENLADMTAKGHRRSGVNPRRGEDHPRAKLDSATVLAIRNDPRSQTAIASAFGISQTNISQIKRHKIWKHI